MDSAIIAALVAGLVSLLLGLLTFVTTRFDSAQSSRRLERQLQRQLSEALFKERLRAYPRAFAITAPLNGGRVFHETFSSEELAHIHDELVEWSSTAAGLLMSRTSMHAYLRLRSLLRKAAYKHHAEFLTPDQVRPIWKARSRLRRTLREDLLLAHQSELDDLEETLLSSR